MPVRLYGANLQASPNVFWKDSNGACEDATSLTFAGSDSEIAPLTLPFTQDDTKRRANLPAYRGYTSFDLMYVLAEAIGRVKSTGADMMVTDLEETGHVGTVA